MQQASHVLTVTNDNKIWTFPISGTETYAADLDYAEKKLIFYVHRAACRRLNQEDCNMVSFPFKFDKELAERSLTEVANVLAKSNRWHLTENFQEKRKVFINLASIVHISKQRFAFHMKAQDDPQGIQIDLTKNFRPEFADTEHARLTTATTAYHTQYGIARLSLVE